MPLLSLPPPPSTLLNPMATPHPNSKTLTIPPSSSDLSAALTEVRLRDHNRRPSNAAAAASPYYRGLTDSALYLRSLGLSPGHASIASSNRSSSSSVFILIQELVPSCFSKSNKKKRDFADEDLPKAPLPAAWDPGLAVMRAGGRPLRESDLAPAKKPDAAAAIGDGAVLVPTGVEGTARMEREYLWAYKYRPRFLREFICNRNRVAELQEMVRKQQCGHLIYEGPTGVGKRTMALAYLRDNLGSEKVKTRTELRTIELKGEHVASINVNLKVSTHHVEVNLSELRGYEKHVLVSLINDSCLPDDKLVECDSSNSRAILVQEADRLSTDAQYYLRWIMEKYKGCNKLFFCCHDASKLETIKHLCKVIKLQPPSDSEIVDVLEFIARKEHIDLPCHLAEKIAKNSKNNLRQAVRSFEASWKSK